MERSRLGGVSVQSMRGLASPFDNPSLDAGSLRRLGRRRRGRLSYSGGPGQAGPGGPSRVGPGRSGRSSDSLIRRRRFFYLSFSAFHNSACARTTITPTLSRSPHQYSLPDIVIKAATTAPSVRRRRKKAMAEMQADFHTFS